MTGRVPQVYGTALDPAGYPLLAAVENHVCRPAYKSHPNHCGHCYYPWPCPTVALYRALLGTSAPARVLTLADEVAAGLHDRPHP